MMALFTEETHLALEKAGEPGVEATLALASAAKAICIELAELTEAVRVLASVTENAG